jgi:hypothetical protein
VVYQRHGLKPGEDQTTQGFYMAGPGGKLLRGWNNRDVPKARSYLREALQGYRPEEAPRLGRGEDTRLARPLEEGGIVLDVFSRVIEARWPPARDSWDEIPRSSTGRDHLWVRKSEVGELVLGRMPESLVRRIARFHLIDNTRGEPPLWRSREVRAAEIKLTPEDGRLRISGTVKLATEAGDRGYEPSLLGYLESRDGKVTRLDLVARGEFWGQGRYTGGAPVGRFTLAVAFALAGAGEASRVPPQGARDLGDYLGR